MGGIKSKVTTTLAVILSIQLNGQVIDIHTNLSFNCSSTYDYDLRNTTGNPIKCHATVLLNIENDGTGRLILYLGEQKTIFAIKSTTDFDSRDAVHLQCANQAGRTFPAGIQWKENRNHTMYIESVWFTNQSDNTAIILYNN